MKKAIVVPKMKKEIADRDALKQESREIAKQLWSGKITANEQKAVNNICLMYNLDPLQKQIVVLGGNFYVTKSGILSIAHQDTNPPDGIELVPATKQERADAGTPEASHYWKAIVHKKGMNRPFIEFGEADDANVRLHNKDWRAISDMAKTRAVNRAVRNAYRIGLTSLEEMGYEEGTVVNVEATEVPAPAPEASPVPQTPAPAIPTTPEAKDPPQNEDTGEERNPNTRYISIKQAKRLFTIAKLNGHNEEDVREYLKVAHNLAHTKDIPTAKYDAIVGWFDKAGK